MNASSGPAATLPADKSAVGNLATGGANCLSTLMRSLLAVLIVGGLAAPRAFAVDEVILRSTGESVKGTVNGVSKTEITLDRAGKAVKVPVTDIAEIHWTDEPPELNITRVREGNGEYAEALKSYRSISGQIDASKENLATDVQFLIARTLARIAVTDPSQKEPAIKALDTFIASHPDSIRHYDAAHWLGRVHVAAGQFDQAKTAYQKLAEAPVPELKMAGQNALGRALLREEDLDGAKAAFESVLATSAEGTAALREQFAAKLGKAMVLQEEGDHEGALAILDEVIAKAAADDADVQAEAFARKGHSLEVLGKTQEALLAYLHVDLLYPGQPGPHAEALYHLTKLWESVEKAERSAAARRKLTERYPKSEWTKKL